MSISLEEVGDRLHNKLRVIRLARYYGISKSLKFLDIGDWNVKQKDLHKDDRNLTREEAKTIVEAYVLENM